MTSMANQRDNLQATVAQGHFGLAELDAEGNFSAANPAFLSMLGMRESELRGKPWHVALHPDDRSSVQTAYSLARTAGRGYVEIRAVRTDGTVVYQALTVTGAVDDRGAFTGYHCLCHDISGYKKAQEALTLAVESAP